MNAKDQTPQQALPDLNHDAISASLDSLSAFTALVRARRAAATTPAAKAGEDTSLAGYMVLGRYLLTARGDFGIATESGLSGVLSPVVEVSEYARVVRGSAMSFKMFSDIPVTADDRCQVCGRGWSVKTIHDVHQVRGHKGPYHKACHALEEAQRDDALVRRALTEAGFSVFRLELLREGEASMRAESERSGQTRASYRAMTPWGAIIIGFRRRNIAVDWSGAELGRAVALDAGTGDQGRTARAAEVQGVERLTALLGKLHGAMAPAPEVSLPAAG